MIKVKFGLYFKKELGTLYKDTELDLDGKEAIVDLDLSTVSHMKV